MMRFKDMEAYQIWQAEREVNLKPSEQPESVEKPDKGKESRLQAKIEQWCRDKGYPFFHDRSRKKNVPGWPDLTICLPNGIVLFLELKSEKGVMRKEQLQIMQQMIFLGHRHWTIKSFKKFLEIVNYHL